MKIIHKFFGKDYENFAKSQNNNFIQINLKQIHSNKVIHLTEENYSELIKNQTEADSIITSMKNIFISVRTADCLPILMFYDDGLNKIVSAVHSGYKGSALKISLKTIEKISKLIGNSFDSKKLKVFIGPHIFAENYQVDKEFYDSWTNDDNIKYFPKENNFEIIEKKNNKKYFTFDSKDESKFLFDNCSYVFDQLICSGISKENIEISNIDTFSNNNFYSYRRGNKDERNISIIGIFDSEL